MDPTPEDDTELPGVDTDFDAKPTWVEVDSDYVSQEHTGVDGLGQQDQEVVPDEAPSAKPNTEPKLRHKQHHPRREWQHVMLEIENSLRSMSPAWQGISTLLH